MTEPVTRQELQAHFETVDVKLDGIKATASELLREVRKTNGTVGDLANWRAMHTQEHSNKVAFHDGQVLALSFAWKLIIGVGAFMAVLATGANLWAVLQ